MLQRSSNVIVIVALDQFREHAARGRNRENKVRCQTTNRGPTATMGEQKGERQNSKRAGKARVIWSRPAGL